jgi:hypothetical protein
MGGTLLEAFFERDGEQEAAGDAAEDGGEVGGGEAAGKAGEGGRAGVLAALLDQVGAIEDERAQHAEDAPDAGAILRRRLPGRGIGGGWLSGAGWRGGHWRR